ncbi:hypothetical protein YC2023_007283 [Brassica napus]
MEEVAKLINGKEIDLGELKTQANQAHILKVNVLVTDSPPFSFVNLYNILIQVLISKVDSFQHYKITNQELGISSLGDAIILAHFEQAKTISTHLALNYNKKE